MALLRNKCVCVFCGERMNIDKISISADRVGICAKCRDEISKTALSMPYAGTRSISYIMSPFEYNGKMREAILEFKFRGCRAYAPLFAAMMEEYLDSYGIWEEFDCLIPVPLHDGRLRERGYNQSELIASHITDIIKVPLRTDILSRTRATKRQSGLKRLDRVLNVQGAFHCGADVDGMNILLLDDICTTGSTLQACAVPLEKAGAKNICALTLAIHDVENLTQFMY